MSAVGLGTAVGRESADVDARLAAVLRAGVRRGVRVLDTAVNYRAGRSERVVGTVVREATADGLVARDELVVVTKGGYVRPRGGVATARPPESHGDLDHCLRPACLRHALASSLDTLGLACVDVYLLHNPEEQLDERFDDTLRSAISVVEQAASDGLIRSWGVSTWAPWHAGAPATRALRPDHLLALARDVGGPDHHFAVIEAPLSLLRRDALTPVLRDDEGPDRSLVAACRDLGVAFVASAAATGGRAPALATASLRWTAGLPGVTTALCASLDLAHVAAMLGTTTAEVGA